ncbi:MAG: hypothetical protein ACI83W_001100 [Marinoscillum sp.]
MKKAFFLLLLAAVFSCTPKKKPVPADVLSHDDMVRLLIDVHILEAKVKKLYVNADSSSKLYHHYEKMLFSELGIKKETYENSLAFYIDEIDAYRDIYDEVVDSLLARQKAKDIN